MTSYRSGRTYLFLWLTTNPNEFFLTLRDFGSAWGARKDVSLVEASVWTFAVPTEYFYASCIF